MKINFHFALFVPCDAIKELIFIFPVFYIYVGLDKCCCFNSCVFSGLPPRRSRQALEANPTASPFSSSPPPCFGASRGSRQEGRRRGLLLQCVSSRTKAKMRAPTGVVRGGYGRGGEGADPSPMADPALLADLAGGARIDAWWRSAARRRRPRRAAAVHSGGQLRLGMEAAR